MSQHVDGLYVWDCLATKHRLLGRRLKALNAPKTIWWHMPLMRIEFDLNNQFFFFFFLISPRISRQPLQNNIPTPTISFPFIFGPYPFYYYFFYFE